MEISYLPKLIKMAPSLLRSVATTAAIAASALPAAFTCSSLSSSSSAQSNQIPKPKNLSLFSSTSHLSPTRLGLTQNLAQPPSALRMDAPSSDHKPTSQMDAQLPELLTEYMVDMTCEGCVKAVKNKLQTIDGVKNVEVDLGNQVVRIRGSSSVKAMTEALEQTGRRARLIGQGVPEDFLISAAVSEFKGPVIFGVVRFAQINMEAARVEASFSGLSPGKHGWSINEYGDLTRGAASTGKIYNPSCDGTANEQVGDLGTLDVNENGEAFNSDVKHKLRVADLIGRALVVYETEDKSIPGVTAAVIARSAGVGENYKKVCTCDGTTIWEANNNEFALSKV